MNSSQAFARIWGAFDAGEIVVVCAWCDRILLDGEWLQPPPAVVDAIDARLAFSHSICSSCAEGHHGGAAPTARSEPRQEGTT